MDKAKAYLTIGGAMELAAEQGHRMTYNQVVRWCRLRIVKSKKVGGAWAIEKDDFLSKLIEPVRYSVRDVAADGMVSLRESQEYAALNGAWIHYYTIFGWCRNNKIDAAYQDGRWYVFPEDVLTMARTMRRGRPTISPTTEFHGRKMSQLAVAIYQYIVRYKEENDGATPSLRTIAKEVGVSSWSNVMRCIRAELVVNGLVEIAGSGSGQVLKVVGAEWKPPQWWVG